MPRPAAVPTRSGQAAGRESASGLAWAFEEPHCHWNEHDVRQLRYWRSKEPAERLAQADAYRRRRHDNVDEPIAHTWRFLAAGEQ